MGSYYSPYEASTSDMLHTQHPTDFEMDHFLALGNSPLLGPVGKGLGGGMKELGDSLDADAGGRTVRAGRGTMFGDLVPISDAYPVPVSESLTSFLSGPDGHNPGEEAFGKSLHEPNLLESFLEKEHPPSAVLRDEGGDGMQTGGQMLPPYREGFEGSAHGALRSSHRTRDFMSGGHPSQGMYDGSVHQAGGYDGCAHRGHVFDGSGHGFEGSAHGGQGFDGAGHHSRGYDGSTHRSQVYEGSSHRVPGFEGSGHHGQAFEGSQHSQGFDGAVTQVSAFPQGVQALSSSPTGGVQVFSTTGHGFSTSFAASDSSFSIPLNSAEQYARTVSHSLAGSSGGTSSQGGDYYSTEMGGSDGSFRGGGLLNSVLVQGPNFLPNGQRMCAWRGCEIAARGRTAFCIVHGGGKKCATEECSNAAEGRTKYCKVHGGGKSCSVEGCQKSAEGKAQMCIAHGGGRRCKAEGCTHSARGSSGLCIRHGGGKRCQREKCQRSAEGHTQLCISHGGGRRCQALGCTKGAQGSTNYCKAHGGGRRCVMPGCTKGAEGRTPFCKAHGGGNRCSYEGGQACTRSVHGGTKFCVAHGGGKRCKFLGCTKSARGRTDFCVRHGGGKRCVAPGCDKSAQGKTDLCKAHGGGKKCQYKADDFLSPCERFARGKTGLCAAHMALMKKKEKEQAEELGVAETGLQLGAPGGPQGLWMRAGGEGPEANQLFYHVFSPNDQFGAARAQPVDDGMEDQKMPYFAMPLPGPDVDSNKFGEGRVRGGGGAAQLLNAPPVPAGPADMDVQKLDEVNAFRQAEASRIVSLYNQNASPDVRHVVGAAHETLSAGGGVFGWASHPRGGEGVAESGPESVGGSSSGRLTDALFSEAYPGSGDERVRGESSVLTWLQSGLPLEKLSSGFGFSDSGSSHGGGWGSTHAGSLFTSHLGGGGQKEEGSKHGGDEMGGSRGFAGHDSMDLSNSGRGMSKGTNSSAVLDPSQGGMSSQGSTHMGAPLPTVEAFLAGFEAGRKRGGAGSSLSTGAVRAPARGGAFQSFSDGGLLSRRPFKPDLRGWEFGVNNNQPGLSHGQGPSAQNSHGLGPNPSPGARGALGSLRRLQERQWQEVQRGRASGDVSMMDHVASLSSPVWLADDAVEMPPPRSSGGVRAQEYRGPFMTRRSQDDLHQAPRTSGAAPFSDAPRRFHFDADSDQETSTFAGSILTQGGLGEDESVRGGNAFYSDEPLASETLNHLMLRDEPECVPSPATAAFVATSMMDSPAVAPLPKSLEGLGPDDLGPDLEHGTFSGMMASIINNSPQLNVQFPSATMGMQKLDLPEPAADSVLSNVSGVFEHV